jgi:ABC-type branched-subunit amino acid transport system ATPase component
MIELLGVGVARKRGGWLLRRVCADLESPYLTVVLSADPAERNALLDVVGARAIPEEGRAWVDGLPVMRETRQRLRALVADIDASAWRAEHRSPRWNPLRGKAEGLDPGARFRRALAAAVGQHPSHLVVRELDAGLRGDDLVMSGRALRLLVDGERVSVLVSAARYSPLLPVADRLLVIAEARLVFDGRPAHVSETVLALHQ